MEKEMKEGFPGVGMQKLGLPGGNVREGGGEGGFILAGGIICSAPYITVTSSLCEGWPGTFLWHRIAIRVPGG